MMVIIVIEINLVIKLYYLKLNSSDSNLKIIYKMSRSNLDTKSFNKYIS